MSDSRRDAHAPAKFRFTKHPIEVKEWKDTTGRVQCIPRLGELTPLTGLDLTHGMCICGHSGQWHGDGPVGFEYHGPCLAGMCSCKAYVYSRYTLGDLVEPNVRFREATE